jgi:glycosyltransferase involved in cell wall biosynthesis
MISLPTFSIVIPTYRRPRSLARCLQALAALDYPRDRFEVIVVDDGSGALPPVRSTSLELTVMTQPHAGPAAARNLGVARARGDYLAFTDDDCMAEAGWLRGFAARLAETPDHAIGGRTLNALPENLYSSATQILLDFLQEWSVKAGSDVFFTANNLAVPAGLFRARGDFDVGFLLAGGEDREFCDRWVRLGGRLTYAPAAVVHHRHHLTLRGYWGQHVNYGRGALRFHRLRAKAIGGRRSGAPLSFYSSLITYPLTRAAGFRRLSLTALLGLAQIATAAGYWREGLRR